MTTRKRRKNKEEVNENKNIKNAHNTPLRIIILFVALFLFIFSNFLFYLFSIRCHIITNTKIYLRENPLSKSVVDADTILK